MEHYCRICGKELILEDFKWNENDTEEEDLVCKSCNTEMRLGSIYDASVDGTKIQKIVKPLLEIVKNGQNFDIILTKEDISKICQSSEYGDIDTSYIAKHVNQVIKNYKFDNKIKVSYKKKGYLGRYDCIFIMDIATYNARNISQKLLDDIMEEDVDNIENVKKKFLGIKTVGISLNERLYDNIAYQDRCTKILKEICPSCNIILLDNKKKGSEYRGTKTHKDKNADNFYIFYDSMIDSSGIMEDVDMLIVGAEFRKNKLGYDGWGRHYDIGVDTEVCRAKDLEIPILWFENPESGKLPTTLKQRNRFDGQERRYYYCDSCFEIIVAYHYQTRAQCQCCKSEIIPFRPWDKDYPITNDQIKKLEELGLSNEEIGKIHLSNDAIKTICSYLTSNPLQSNSTYSEICSLVSYLRNVPTYPSYIGAINIDELRNIPSRDLYIYLSKVKNEMKRTKFRFLFQTYNGNHVKNMFSKYGFKKVGNNKYESQYLDYDKQNKLESVIIISQDKSFIKLEYHGYRSSKFIDNMKHISIKEVVYEEENDIKKSRYAKIARHIKDDIDKNDILNKMKLMSSDNIVVLSKILYKDYVNNENVDRDSKVKVILDYVCGYEISEKVEYTRPSKILNILDHADNYISSNSNSRFYKLLNNLRDICTWKLEETHNIYDVNIDNSYTGFVTEIGELIIDGSIIRKQAEYLKTVTKKEFEDITNKSIILKNNRGKVLRPFPYIKGVLKHNLNYGIIDLYVKPYSQKIKKLEIEFMARASDDINEELYTRFVDENEKDHYEKLRDNIKSGNKYILFLLGNEIHIEMATIYRITCPGAPHEERWDSARDMSIEDAVEVLKGEDISIDHMDRFHEGYVEYYGISYSYDIPKNLKDEDLDYGNEMEELYIPVILNSEFRKYITRKCWTCQDNLAYFICEEEDHENKLCKDCASSIGIDEQNFHQEGFRILTKNDFNTLDAVIGYMQNYWGYILL